MPVRHEQLDMIDLKGSERVHGERLFRIERL